jgi:hypothetical protein
MACGRCRTRARGPRLGPGQSLTAGGPRAGGPGDRRSRTCRACARKTRCHLRHCLRRSGRSSPGDARCPRGPRRGVSQRLLHGAKRSCLSPKGCRSPACPPRRCQWHRVRGCGREGRLGTSVARPGCGDGWGRCGRGDRGRRGPCGRAVAAYSPAAHGLCCGYVDVGNFQMTPSGCVSAARAVGECLSQSVSGWRYESGHGGGGNDASDRRPGLVRHAPGIGGHLSHGGQEKTPRSTPASEAVDGWCWCLGGRHCAREEKCCCRACNAWDLRRVENAQFLSRAHGEHSSRSRDQIFHPHTQKRGTALSSRDWGFSRIVPFFSKRMSF